jgi:exodeoxyribonuclease-3
MKIATWNVNSIRARERRLLRWLEREKPDLVCLQELKVESEEFPHDTLLAAGYHVAVFGQKRLNGVAILARRKPRRVEQGMGNDDGDTQARLVGAEVAGVRILSAYFPSGRSVGSDEFGYKLQWMARLRDHLAATASPDDALILAGDFNVAPDDRDAANPELWGGSVLCHDAVREALERIRAWGLVDLYRHCHPEGDTYTWWDYQRRAFERNDGLRIDHIFATRTLAERCSSLRIDRAERKGTTTDRPSDHAPVVATFDV